MNEAFRAIMSDVVLPLFTVALVIAAIIVITNYAQKASFRRTGAGYAADIQSRQPKIAGYEPCTRCGGRCGGYDMTIPGQEQNIYWQHVQTPGVQHHPDIVIHDQRAAEFMNKGRAGY